MQSHLKDSIDRYQSLPSFRARLQAANPESITTGRRARPYGDNCKANEMALSDAQKRARKSPWNKCAVKGPKAAHGSNQVLLQSRNPCRIERTGTNAQSMICP